VAALQLELQQDLLEVPLERQEDLLAQHRLEVPLELLAELEEPAVVAVASSRASSS
jgi:hypothetical protein